MGITAAELRIGLVLTMEPFSLANAQCTVIEKQRAEKERPFLCVERGEGKSYWTPLFSGPGNRPGHRGHLGRRGRTGDPRWASSESYYDPDQLWCISDEAVVAAAAGDLSKKGNRNLLDPR